MRLGILIVGSLYWDRSPVRCVWRQNRLARTGERHVRVPIRYGRRSDKRGNTFTMVFATSCSEPAKLGTGLVVPTRAECSEPAHLLQEAEHLWAAERDSEQGGDICASWGAVCILQNPDVTLPEKFLKAWQTKIKAAGDSYRPLATADGEEQLLDARTGTALYSWPIDDETKDPLSGFDVLLMTATAPTLNRRQYPTANQIADAWRADKRDNVLYFHSNRHHGITTFQDNEILSVLRHEPVERLTGADSAKGPDMQVQRDQKGQPFIEWEQAPGGFKRAWIQRKTDPGKDWASTGRYLNVVRIESLGAGPAGNATDFPVFSSLTDEQILEAFVASVCAITGCRLP